MSSPLAVQSFRVSLWQAGYPFVEVKTNGKDAVRNNWPERARQMTDETAKAYPDPEALSTGILTDGLVAVDIDHDDPATASEIERIVRQILGNAPKRYREESPRCLLLYASSDPARTFKRIKRVDVNGSVEFLCRGHHFVADGLHKNSKRPYLWDEPIQRIPRNTLTVVTPDQVDFCREELAKLLGAASPKQTDVYDPLPTVVQTTPPVPTEAEKRIAQSVLKSLCEGLAAMTKGQGRNQALNDAALQMGEICSGWGIDHVPVGDALWEASIDNGYVVYDGKAVAKGTLESGFRKGWSQPRPRHAELETMDFSGLTVGGKSPFEGIAEKPRPLRRKMASGNTFPMEALGTSLHWAAFAIADKIQCPPAIAALSVLGAASLAVQAHGDVMLPKTGHTKPLSLFLISIGASGERKSAADREALRAVYDREKELTALYTSQIAEHRNAHAAWEAMRTKILKSASENPAAIASALNYIGEEPKAPLTPILTCPEPTFEGLCNLYVVGYPALGLFSDEGGVFVGGHALSADSRLRTIAGLSMLWDGSPIKRVRAAKDGSYVLPGRRLAMHLMLQPDVAAGLLSDPMLKDQGLLSRLLVSHPPSTAGTRFQRDLNGHTQGALDAYSNRLYAILQQQPALAVNSRNELQPGAVRLEDAAQIVWCTYADKVETELRPGGKYEPIKGLANKLPEHAARIAGVLTLYDDLRSVSIRVDTLQRAITIADHFADEALRLFDAGMVSPEVALAETLYEWLTTKWTEPYVGLSVMYQRGPTAIRDAKTAKAAVGTLVDHGWLTKAPHGSLVSGKPVKDAWRIVRDVD